MNQLKDLLISPSELGLSTAQQVSDEIGVAADVDVAFMGAAAQALIKCSGVALLFTAIQLTNKDVVGPQYFVFTICAEPEHQRGNETTRVQLGSISS